MFYAMRFLTICQYLTDIFCAILKIEIQDIRRE